MKKITAIFRPCPGEAHRNGHIDHCGECMPLWGVQPFCADCNFRLSVRPNRQRMTCNSCGGFARRDDYKESKMH